MRSGIFNNQFLTQSLLSPMVKEFWKSVNICRSYGQWLKWFCEAGGGAHLTKPGWSKPHTHSNPTNLALFRRKIALYRFNKGVHTIGWGSNGSRGRLSPPPLPEPRHFNHCCHLSYTKTLLGARSFDVADLEQTASF